MVFFPTELTVVSGTVFFFLTEPAELPGAGNTRVNTPGTVL